jgi:prevent-host-death family protein
MERVVPATEARVRFGELMRQVVERDETVVVERDGKPQVVVVSVAGYRRLREAAGRYATLPSPLEHVVAVGVRIAARRAGRDLTPPDEVIRAVRDERDDDADDLR